MDDKYTLRHFDFLKRLKHNCSSLFTCFTSKIHFCSSPEQDRSRLLIISPLLKVIPEQERMMDDEYAAASQLVLS